MKTLIIFLVLLGFISCKPIGDLMEGRKTEPVTKKVVDEYNIDLTKYNVRTSKKMFFESKSSEPNKNNDPNLITENVIVYRKCIITENNDGGLVVQFDGMSFNFRLTSKGTYEIIENQESNGNKYKLIKGKCVYLTMKVKRLKKSTKIKGEKQ